MHKISRLPSDTSPRNPPERTEDNLKILHHALIINPLHVIPNLVRHNLLNIRLIRIFSLPQNHALIHILYRCSVRNARPYCQRPLLLLGIEPCISLTLHYLIYLRILPKFCYHPVTALSIKLFSSIYFSGFVNTLNSSIPIPFSFKDSSTIPFPVMIAVRDIIGGYSVLIFFKIA